MNRFAPLALAFAGLSFAAAAAEPDDGFFKGKQMQMIVPTTAGGAYDVYGRLVAQYIVNYIPGQPTIVVQNMFGASGLAAANYVYNVAPKDGTVIGIMQSSIPTAPLLSPEGVRFDSTKFSWVGSATKDPFVGYYWHTSAAQTYEEAKTRPIIMGGNSIGAAGVDYAIVSNNLFGTKFKIVTGYPNSTDVKLAMEKGEVDGTFANAYGSLKTAEPSWIPEKKVRIMIQHGLTKHPDLPDVPLFIDQAKTPADRQALELLLARQEFAKPFVTAPGVPAARLAVLRRAFDETLKDKGFLAAAAKARVDIEQPMTGDALTAIVGRVSSTPPEVTKKIEKMFTDFQQGKQ
jgi:tripartite-type tricarboxylate transporter receptor subunit TctC